jgi:hypothetical protein
LSRGSDWTINRYGKESGRTAGQKCPLPRVLNKAKKKEKKIRGDVITETGKLKRGTTPVKINLVCFSLSIFF